MSTITILGAGAMGSAIATPLRDAGHQVRLWGTHLDDHLIAAVRDGKPHPRTKVPLAGGSRPSWQATWRRRSTGRTSWCWRCHRPA